MKLIDAAFQKKFPRFAKSEHDDHEHVYVLQDVDSKVVAVVTDATASSWVDELKGEAL